MAGKKKKAGAPKAEPPAGDSASPPAAPTAPSSAAPPPSGGAPPPDGSRRRFLKLAGAGALAAGAAGVWYARSRAGGDDHDHDHHADAGAPGGPRWQPVPRPAQLVTFNEHQYDTLDAVAGVLIPADDQDPGARETGAMIYVDRAMGNPAFVAAARMMKVAVAAIDWQSNQTFGKKFVELSPGEQEPILQATYQGEGDRGSFKGRTFMNLMMGLVLEGHLAEPVHGGNKDGIGWALVGFEPVDPRPGRPMPSGGHGHH